MPFLNSQGRVAHGKGAMGAFLDGAPIDAGGGACWLDEWLGDTVAYQHGGEDGWYVALYDVAAGTWRRAVPDPAHPFFALGCNTLCAGGGLWAAWLAGVGLFTSSGLHLPSAGLLAVGPAGELAYRPDYQSLGPAVVRERDGTEWHLTDGPAGEVQLLGSGRALWTEGPTVIGARNLPMPLVLPGGTWAPRVLVLEGAWWLCYYAEGAGVVLHPFDRLEGYVVVPPGVNAWHDAAKLGGLPDVARVVWSVTEGEGAGDLRWRDVNVTTEPRVPLTPAPPVVEPPPVEVVEPPPVEPIDPPPVEPIDPPPNPEPVPPLEVLPVKIALSEPAYVNWRWGGGQSLDPPTAPDDPNRAPFEFGRPTAGADEWCELVPAGEYYAVRAPNGRSWLSVQPDGTLEERDAGQAPGAWELFALQPDGVLVECPKEGITRPLVEFVP